MAKAVTPAEARKNLAIVHTMIDQLPKDQSAVVGINALGQLADLMPHEEFVQWIDGALHHATTGQIPPEDTQDAGSGAQDQDTVPGAAQPSQPPQPQQP